MFHYKIMYLWIPYKPCRITVCTILFAVFLSLVFLNAEFGVNEMSSLGPWYLDYHNLYFKHGLIAYNP